MTEASDPSRSRHPRGTPRPVRHRRDGRVRRRRRSGSTSTSASPRAVRPTCRLCSATTGRRSARRATSTPTYARRGCSTPPSRWRAVRPGGALIPRRSAAPSPTCCVGAVGSAERVIISHEIFGSATRDQIARMAPLLDGFEVHLVVTGRDLGRTATAEWQEQVKNGNPRSFQAFVDDLMSHLPEDLADTTSFWRSQNLRTLLDRWQTLVPAERIHIVTCPRSGSAPDLLWRRFAEAVELAPRRRRPLPDPAAQRVARHRADRVPAPGRGRARRAARSSRGTRGWPSGGSRRPCSAGSAGPPSR